MSEQREKVVLAYSGGLDTSVMVKWLQIERNLDVIAICGNVGQDEEDLEWVKQKAYNMGAIYSDAVDLRKSYASRVLTKAIAANALYENTYPLLSALSRPMLAKYLVDYAHKHGAHYIAHGCTGKGNDQVRFETCIHALDPDLEIIAPVREWDLLTREQEMEWAAEHDVPVPTTAAKPYSIDDNLWGRAIECGVLEDPWNEPPEDIYTMTGSPENAPDKPEYVEIGFEAGIPCALDGQQMSYIDIIYKLNEIAGRNGYGRLDMIENRLVGVKSRECYEQPAALALITAHKALEDMCLEREVLHYKLGIEQKWAEVVYYGQWFAPLKAALDGFINATQEHVTGTVRCKFYKGTCTVVGRRSDYSVYDYALATYDKGDSFNHESSAGFIELFALPAKTWAENRLKNA